MASATARPGVLGERLVVEKTSLPDHAFEARSSSAAEMAHQ
ncbi:MAG TPA: hypothetical protein VG518_05880 [Solirubrobacterales bacterium]|nr:hypothetical protein [Solirubrobacterales bacterium]